MLVSEWSFIEFIFIGDNSVQEGEKLNFSAKI